VIVRVATFAPMTPEVEAEARRNMVERFKPALAAQPGLLAAYWTTAEDGHWVSITTWESAEALERGSAAANATPLLPGQDPEKIPSPARMELLAVMEHVHPST
jgi:heme-degrading monooxygenase HmoA